jgi:DNA repair protein SbcD/Mre11
MNSFHAGLPVAVQNGMFHFIHAADLHLDSPLKGLSRFDGAPVRRIQSATRTAFANLVDLAVERKVAFVLLAGDLWDGEWQDAGPGLFFLSQARRLAQAGIHVYAIKGNHDAASRITQVFDWPEHVHFFPHKKPAMMQVPSLNVFIHGQSYDEQHVRRDISGRYLHPERNVFNIGMLHTCLEDGTDYAPTCLDKLFEHGYQYWALGHIHDRQEWTRDGVHIAFPGNLQGRSMRETGPKGCSVVTVDDDFRISTEFVPLDDVRWTCVSIEARDAELEPRTREALRRAVKENGDRILAVRLIIKGRPEQEGQALRDRLNSVAVDVGPEIWIERIEVSAPAQENAPALTLDTELRKLLAEVAADPAVAAEVTADLTALRNALPEEADCVSWKDAAGVQELAAQIAEEI